ncbi:MAG: hypothetical protein HC842_04410 [Cytophagales bacterium]|nr:hypothetical protein [Cytophagales bacterium]
MRQKVQMEVKVSPKLKTSLALRYGVAAALLVSLVAAGLFLYSNLGVQERAVASGNATEALSDLGSADGLEAHGNQPRVVLDKAINSEFVECRPIISHDGHTLYFSRRFHPQNSDGEKDLMDVWMSTNEGGRWTPAVPLSTLNDKRENTIFSVSPDQNELLFLQASTKKKDPLLRAVREGELWSKPQAVTVSDYYNDNTFLDFHLSYEHEVMFLAVQRKDSYGDQDIYISFKQSDLSWSEPLNLGAVVNSPDADFAPFLSANGEYLFFCLIQKRWLRRIGFVLHAPLG